MISTTFNYDHTKGLTLSAISYILNKNIYYIVSAVKLSQTKSHPLKVSKPNETVLETISSQSNQFQNDLLPIEIKKEIKEKEENQVLLLLSDSSVLIYNFSFSSLKYEIEYRNIKQVLTDKSYSSLILIELKENIMNEKKFCLSFNGCLVSFLEQLKILYLLCENCDGDEIQVNQSEKLINSYYINKKIFLQNEENLIENVFSSIPIGYEIYITEKDYMFFLPQRRQKEGNTFSIYKENVDSSKKDQVNSNIYINRATENLTASLQNQFENKRISKQIMTTNINIKQNNLTNKVNPYIQIEEKENQVEDINNIIYFGYEIENKYPIEKFYSFSNMSNKEISYYAYHTFTYYMENKHFIEEYIITNQSHFMKKFNFHHESAKVEAWRIDAKTPLVDNLIGYNIVYIFLRRKFLPPFGDFYQNSSFYIIEPYLNSNDNDNDKLSEYANETIEIIVNSLTPLYEDRSMLMSSELSSVFHQFQIEGFVTDYEKLDFLNFNLHLVSDFSTDFVFKFTVKTLLILKDYIKDKIDIIMTLLIDKVRYYYQIHLQIKEFNIDKYFKDIKEMDYWDILIENNSKYIQKYMILDEKDGINMLFLRRNDFLFWFLNGGGTGSLLTIEDIINCFTKYPLLSNYSYIFEILLNPLCKVEMKDKNQALYNIKQLHIQLIDDKVSTLNMDYLNILIKTGYLKTLFRLNDTSYIHLLKSIIKKFPLYTTLLSIKFYIKSIIKDYEHENFSYSSSFTDLISPLFNLYSDISYSPLISLISCKILYYLSYSNMSLKQRLIQMKIFNVLDYHIYSNNENMLYSSLLLYNILIQCQKDNLKQIINNEKLKSKLVNVIKGTNIKSISYSSKTIILSIDIIQFLLKNDSSNLKSSSFSSSLLMNLLTLFQISSFSQKDLFEFTSQFEMKIVEVIETIIRKNSEIRERLFLVNKFHNIIDFKCKSVLYLFDLYVLNDSSQVGVEEEANIRVDNMKKDRSDLHFPDFISALLRLTLSFIQKDSNIIFYIKNYCQNILDLVFKIFEFSNIKAFSGCLSIAYDLFQLLGYGEN